MSEELDVFAADGAANASADGQGGRPHPLKKFRGPRKPFPRQQQKNNSPIRGANGEESVNPLLNAPLPQEQRTQDAEAPANPNRNPELPEYRLADIQTWTAPQVVERMMPGADPEELGTYRKHELIFAAIRTYLKNPAHLQPSRWGR